MYDTVPTVRVKSGDSFATINESDFDESVHELFDAPPAGTEVEIPADWADIHHTKQIALAKALTGADVVPAEGQTQTEAAREIIAVAAAERAAA